MIKREICHPENIKGKFSTAAYSAAAGIDGWVFVSGQGPLILNPANSGWEA